MSKQKYFRFRARVLRVDRAAQDSAAVDSVAPAALVEKYADKPGANNDDHRPLLGAMAEIMDRSFGRVLEHLRSSGQERNTLVVFTTDHGAFGRSATRKPLRGAKADLYEGGVRVPLIYRWPSWLTA